MAVGVAFRDVCTAFGDKAVLRGTSFDVPSGAVTVLLGPSGAGKTTCVSHLAGLQPPDAGEILVDGRSVWGMRPRELAAFRRRCGMMLQGGGVFGSALWESLTAHENLVLQLRALADLDEEAIAVRADERLAELGLARYRDMVPAELSGGTRKILGIARALVADPELAILDSFELGIDGVRLTRISDMVRAHHERCHNTNLIVTHDMEVAQRLADHFVVLNGGEVAAAGSVTEVLASREPAVRQLLTGGRTGPIGLPSVPTPSVAAPPASDPGYDVPIWVAALVLLIALSATALFLGAQAGIVEIALVAAVWTIAVAVFLAHGRRRAARSAAGGRPQLPRTAPDRVGSGGGGA